MIRPPATPTLFPYTTLFRSDLPRAEAPVDTAACDDRHRRPAGVEPDAARVEQLHSLRRPQVEQPARLEEELALFGEKEGKPREVDDLLVGFHLREVGAGGEVRR